MKTIKIIDNNMKGFQTIEISNKPIKIIKNKTNVDKMNSFIQNNIIILLSIIIFSILYFIYLKF